MGPRPQLDDMILVSGASGFVGRHLVEALHQRIPSEKIRVFDAQPPARALPAGVETFCGVIEDPAAVAPAVQGAETVVHLAAKVQPDSRELHDLARVNVDGTRQLYSAAVQAGCKLFLHMSSAGVYGPPRSPDPFRESDAVSPATPYQRTKWEAEEALRHTDAKGTTLNILRPAGIYGAGSYLEIPGYKRVLRQKWSIELKGGVIVHPTHVSDVVEAVLAVLERPAPHGTVFNVGGERPILLQDFQALVAAALNVPRWRLVLPSTVTDPLARVVGPLLTRTGRQIPLLIEFGRGHVFSSAVDDRVFRLRYPRAPVRSLRNGLQEHIDWARTHRLL